MAKYRALERTFINNRLYEPGDEIVVQDEFPSGKHLEPMDDAAKTAHAQAVFGPVPSEPDYIMKLVANANGEPSAPETTPPRKK